MEAKKTLLVLIIFKMITGNQASKDPPPTNVLGATVNPLPNPIFYTDYVTLIFETQVPPMTTGDIRVKWPNNKENNNCPSLDTYGCPVTPYYNNFIDTFYSKIRSERHRNSVPPPENATLPTFPCRKITKHFPKFSVSASQWSTYLETLKNCCPSQTIQIQELPNRSSISFNNTQLDLMLGKFRSVYIPPMESKSTAAIYTNAYSTFQAVGLLNSFVSTENWRESLSLCDSNLLPLPLVNFPEFANGWAKLNGKLTNNTGFQMSLEFADKELYYQLKLTECTRIIDNSNANSTLMIKSLIPIRPAGLNFSLVEIKASPFAVELNASKDKNLVCSLQGKYEGKYVVENHNGAFSGKGFIAKTDCEPHELCHIDFVNHWTPIDPCVSAVIKEDSEGVQKFCKTSCFHVDTERFPIIVQMKSDQFVVLALPHPKFDIFLSDPGMPVKMIKPKETGAVEVTLACGHRITYRNQEFKANFPCGKDHHIRHIIPVAFLPGVEEFNFNENVGKASLEIQHLVKEMEELKSRNFTIIWLAIVVAGLFGFVALILIFTNHSGGLGLEYRRTNNCLRRRMQTQPASVDHHAGDNSMSFANSEYDTVNFRNMK